jgi:ketosteroid isomerase-like protein
MKKSSVAFLLIFYLLASLCLWAQTPEEREREERLRREAAEAEIQREELVNLQQETVRALQLHNGSFFNRVYSDDFLWTSPSGGNLDKTKFVDNVESSNIKYSSFVVSDIRVRVFQQTAVVTCLWSARGSSNGSNFSRQSRVITVYVSGQRGWQVVASQETQLPG